MSEKKKPRFETLQVHAGQEQPDPATGARAVPIYQTTSFVFDDCAHAEARFNLSNAGNIYSRLTNPTQDAFEQRVAALEGGAAALATASGAAAVTYALQNLAEAGDHIVAEKTLYGGTYNLLAHTLKAWGIDTTFVDPLDPGNFERAIRPETKALYMETLGNPHADVADMEAIAEVAHRHGLPLIVDNTFATPINCQPFQWGADIVTHSTTKYMDGHASALGGAIVDSGKFDWTAYPDKFPGLCTPDDSYHGVTYTQRFGLGGAFITKCTAQLMRDFGCVQSPQNAFLLNLGLESLPFRMKQHCANAQAVAEFLQGHEKVKWVKFAGLKGDKYYDLAHKYMPNGTCGVISFGLYGGRKAAETFMKHLKLGSIETHVADSHTCCLHPASSTHRQMTDAELDAAGVGADLIRLSCGLENAQDLIEDIAQALENV